MLKKIIAAAALATMAASSYAAGPNTFYAGVEASSTKIDDVSGHKGGFGGLVGYNFNQNWAIEGTYRRLASFDVAGLDVDIDQAVVAAIGTLPLSNGFSVYGRLGYGRLEAKASAAGISGKEHDNGGVYGVGVGYDFGNNITGRLELQKPSSDSTAVTAGVVFAF